MAVRIALVFVLVPAVARADHHGMAMESHAGGGSSFGASVALVAASYSTTSYVGDYEGVVPSLSWSMDRFSAGANVGLYRLQENGRDVYGQGDAVVHGGVGLVTTHELTGGAVLAVSAPTGDNTSGLGMGHVMVMPALAGAWHRDRLTLAASGGYSRALVGMDSSHHDHGPWPLVEPMNMSEISWSASGDCAIAGGVHAGARMTGGVPVGAEGHERVVGALRVAWGQGRVATGAEVQAGFAGDPFTIRGVVDTALQF